MKREIPPQWAELMDRRGLSSIRQLAAASGVSHPAIGRLIHREGQIRDATVLAIAKALAIDPQQVYNMAGIDTPAEAGNYTPPREAARLSHRERRAVDEMIRLLVNKDRAVEEPLTNDEPLPQGAYRLAAEKGMSSGRQGQLDSDERGEESQDSEQQAED